ncbi:serine/threonine-protein phosphatase 6 regulatory ankyrin repeat subunit A-like [Saccostrea cucullata]|uniref:serine/threonine-protein phosphatase 6 regulatory ankyrin repeat subunit A-like n=1 Tax=Saccostrea cuccullata TaxID=36930 RepID=UPI002ED0F2ED
MASLLDSVNNNNPRFLKVLLAVPQSISKQELEAAFLQSSKLGHSECIQCILATGIDTEIEDTNGRTPLFLAVESNKPALVEILLDSNCNVNVRGPGQTTPVHMAAKLIHNECLKLLVSHRAKINLRDSCGNTPLIIATKYGNYEALDVLVKAGCNVNIQNKEGCSALHYASHQAGGVNLLLAAGADPNVRDEDNITPLIMAASQGFDEVVKSLVRAHCDVNVQNNSAKKTALHILAWKGHPDCIKDIILGGADVNIYDKFHKTSLWYAIKNKHVEVVKLLLRANCLVDTFQCLPTIPSEACPVRLALSEGLFDVIKLFVLTGFDRGHLRARLKDTELRERIHHHKDIEHWLEHAEGMLTLKQICRQWIRHHLGLAFYHHLHLLPIPPAMRDFISMKELDEEH